MAKIDLSKYKKFIVSGIMFYYEETEDGQRILRHIQVFNSRTILNVEGNVGIDVVPANSVGSKQIEDDSVEMEDLSPEVREKIGQGSGLTEEEKQAVADLANSEEISEEEATDMWEEAMRQAQLDGNSGTQGAGTGSGGGTVQDGDGEIDDDF